METLKGTDEHIRIPGFYDQAKPMSATDKQRFDAQPDNEAFLREQFGVKEFVRGLTGRALDYAVFEPTCNIQGIFAGYQGEGLKTVILAEATCKIDFRLVPDQDPDDIFARLRTHLDQAGFVDVESRRLGQMWPYMADADHPFIEQVARTGQAVYGRSAQILPLDGGSTPIYAFATPLGGIPVVLGPGVSYGRNNRHSPNEHMRLIDFQRAAQHIGRIVAEFATI